MMRTGTGPSIDASFLVSKGACDQAGLDLDSHHVAACGPGLALWSEGSLPSVVHPVWCRLKGVWAVSWSSMSATSSMSASTWPARTRFMCRSMYRLRHPALGPQAATARSRRSVGRSVGGPREVRVSGSLALARHPSHRVVLALFLGPGRRPAAGGGSTRRPTRNSARCARLGSQNSRPEQPGAAAPWFAPQIARRGVAPGQCANPQVSYRDPRWQSRSPVATEGAKGASAGLQGSP